MFENIENLKIHSILKSKSKNKRASIHRDRNIFIIRITGCTQYEFKTKSFDIHPGEVIFIPKDENYMFSKLTDEECKYLSIRFDAKLTNAEPTAYSITEFEQFEELINKMEELWKFGNKAEHYKCYSIFYNFLSYIESRERMTDYDKKKLKILSPAITYIKKNIYNCELKVGELNKLCGISNVYFNKIFNDNFRTTPHKFISTKRLIHAKSILDSGDFESISEVAQSVGYSDPLYFSRAFKRKFGVSPSNYTKSLYRI